MEKNFSVELTPAELQAIKDAIATIVAILADKLKALSPEERKRSVKMGEASKPFVEKVLEYSVSNPEFLPAFVKQEVLEKQWKSVQELTPVFNSLNQLLSNLGDSILEMGSILMGSSNAYYNQTKVGVEMDIPNAKPVHNDLKVRYERKPKQNGDKDES
jgi:hypothetical protein